MIQFKNVDLNTFLKEYWQKKPLIIRQALPDFINPLAPEELAGLALEEDVEGRIIIETADQIPQWHLKRSPFSEQSFTTLPETNWTLLVQGVDKLVPEVGDLLNHFNFIPQWRVDDVMISYAALNGSVGPHYDNYDVFLFQALGRREWSLTSKQCTPQNYINDLELRIMREFNTEMRFILEEGDMLYLPAHIGHHGVSLSQDCMTYSFGYRSYTGQELLDSLGEFISEKELFNSLYKDPDWSTLKNSSELQAPAWHSAQKLLKELINNEEIMHSWFGCFATQTDQQSEQFLPLPLEEDELPQQSDFITALQNSQGLIRDACCRFAYIPKAQGTTLFINGCAWDTAQVSPDLIALIANNRRIELKQLNPFLKHIQNQNLLYDLFTLQWLQLWDLEPA